MEEIIKKEFLNKEIGYESERLNFNPALNLDPNLLRQQADLPEIAIAVSKDFPIPYTIDSANWFLNKVKERWENGEEYNFAMFEKESGKFCGMIGFKVSESVVTNIGYWFGKDFWGKGLATESLLATINFIENNFSQSKKIKASAYKYNIASQKVLIKCGFIKVGERVTEELLRNNEKDESNLYELIF